MAPYRPQQLISNRSLVRAVLLPLALVFFLNPKPVFGSPASLEQQVKSLPAAPAKMPDAKAASPQTQAETRAAPNATPYPFLRLVAVLLSGLVISAAQLAQKFRRFWGLGVFTNPYAPLFLAFGVGLCGLPVTSEPTLRTIPFIGAAAPWIADLFGIFVSFMLPVLRFKQETQEQTESSVRDLAEASSANPVLAVIEDAIRDHILERMQLEIVEAARLYDWDTIKDAAHRALEEEMTIRPLPREDYETAQHAIESFTRQADPRLDSRDKYEALLHILRWCSFKRLRRSLELAARGRG